ncbi:YdgA family protein [Desulfoluna sp.]|uniref:YdgA family protein n=1 Tax=Desulfoluna sp. TaxID=2045199 RepID=UPI00261C2588|nr:DUF945 family protein [Desulfoluna sp.]
MKKALGGIIILGLILLLGAPWYVGRQVETFYSQITDETLQKNPTLELTDLNYQRGWFSSTITGSMSLKTMGQDLALPAELRYKSVITHGPVFWGALSSKSPVGLALDHSTLWIEPTEDEEVDLNAVLKELPPFKMESLIGFDKTIDSVYSIEAYTKTIEGDKNPVNIAFAGLNGSGTFNWATRDFNFKAEAPSFTVTESDTEKLSIDSVILSANKNQGDTSARYDISQVAITSKDASIRFNLDDAYVAAQGIEKAEVYNSTLELGFKSLKTHELSYAPASLQILLDNLDKASMDALRTTINEATANADEMGSNMYGMMIMGKVMELLPEILKRNPKLTLASLNLGTAKDEALTATGYAAVVGEKAANLPSMALIMQALDAQFEAALPKAFLNTFMDLGKLMQLMDQGFLVSDGKYYRTQATIKEGHVTINGNTIM